MLDIVKADKNFMCCMQKEHLFLKQYLTNFKARRLVVIVGIIKDSAKILASKPKHNHPVKDTHNFDSHILSILCRT